VPGKTATAVHRTEVGRERRGAVRRFSEP